MSMSGFLVTAWKWRIRAAMQTRHNRRRMSLARTDGKVFCVGLNKTGTTTWTEAMTDLGYVVGSETAAIRFYDDWKHRDFSRIIEYCRTDGQAFQDFPFSLPGTYRAMDRAFPGSKFVLTVRDSAEQWYDSLIKFHSKHWSISGQVPPKAEDLACAVYWRKGLLADYCHDVFDTPVEDPYNREILLRFYRDYNRQIENYFSSRPSDFLIVNVSETGAYNRMRQFLGFPPGGDEFPWKNKT